MKNIVLTFFSLLIMCACFNDAMACWCRRVPLETEEEFRNAVVEELRNSDAVFSGEVIEIGKYDIKFKVTKVWKGKIAETEITLSRWYYTKRKDDEVFIECSFQSFEVGKNYLLYSDLFENKLQVEDCSRSQFLNEAGRDVKVLDLLKSEEILK